MSGFGILVLIALFITLLILVAGIVLMAFGGTLNEKYGNRLMMMRVIAQGVAVGLLALLMLSR